MENWMWAILLKPLFAVIVLFLLAVLAAYFVQRYAVTPEMVATAQARAAGRGA